MQVKLLSIIPDQNFVSESEKSGYVINHRRKLAQKKGGVIPQEVHNSGNVTLSWVHDDESRLYRCIWKSKMSNSVTTINRLAHDRYLVSRTAPNMEPQSFVFADKEPAIRAFFINTDLYRISDAQSEDARKWCADHLKRAEGLKSIFFNAKKTKAAQSNFNKDILIGPNKEHRGRLIAVDYSGKKIKVKILNPDTKQYGKARTISADLAWFE
jgi:hypothetical protein